MTGLGRESNSPFQNVRRDFRKLIWPADQSVKLGTDLALDSESNICVLY